jgi:hypothetical protein
MNHAFTFIKSRAWRYFVHWSLWMFNLDDMRMKTAFTPFTLDESSAMHIQSVKCKSALTKPSNTLCTHFHFPPSAVCRLSLYSPCHQHTVLRARLALTSVVGHRTAVLWDKAVRA